MQSDRVSQLGEQQIPLARLLGITLFAFALGMGLNTLEPALLSARVVELTPEIKNTSLGILTSMGLVVAILVQPLIGEWSDKNRSPLGKRIPFLIAGTIIVIVSLFSAALVPAISLLVFAVLFYQFGSNTVQSPFQALIPDEVPFSQRGLASGIKAALEILGFIAGRRASGFLIAQGDTLLAVSLTSGVFLLVLGITSWAVRDRRQQGGEVEGPTEQQPILQAFLSDWQSHKAFRIWFFNRGLFWGGVIALNTFLLFYLTDVAGKTMPEAQRFFADLSTILGLSVILITYPAGRLSDRWGRRPFIFGACICAALGAAMLLFLRTDAALYGAGALIGTATGVFLTTNWALATELVPVRKAARFLGIANIATAGASFASRIGGGLLIDPINIMSGNPATGYMLFFGLAVMAFLTSGLLILRVPESSGFSSN